MVSAGVIRADAFVTRPHEGIWSEIETSGLLYPDKKMDPRTFRLVLDKYVDKDGWIN